MIRIDFTPEKIDALNHERYHHPHPKVQKKMEVLYLKSQGLQHKRICSLCRITEATLTTYIKDYQMGGIDLLKKLDYKGQPSQLREHESTIEQYFKDNPPRNTAEAQAAILKLTGIKRSPTQIRVFMKRIGLRCRKIGHIPAKATTSDKTKEQEEFKKKSLSHGLRRQKTINVWSFL
jgi:transposase